MTRVRCILCPTDFSDPAATALEHACELAKVLPARLVLLHVIAPAAYPLPELATLPGFPDLQGELRKAVETDLEGWRRRVPAGIAVEVALREGVPHDEILAAARESACDLIVMATHGRTGWKHALLGSIAERVVRLSQCPVLTVRGPGPQQKGR